MENRTIGGAIAIKSDDSFQERRSRLNRRIHAIKIGIVIACSVRAASTSQVILSAGPSVAVSAARSDCPRTESIYSATPPTEEASGQNQSKFPIKRTESASIRVEFFFR